MALTVTLSSLARTRSKNVSIDIDLYDWIEKGIENNKFRTFSQAVNDAVRALKDSESS